jgi:sigma-E factor negative regulatory protein RseB
VVAALAGAGLVATAAPAVAAPREEAEQAALVLLGEAAHASRTLAYAGTEYAATWGLAATSTLVEVEHVPGRGARVTRADGGGHAVVVPSVAVHDELLDVLADRYELRVTGEGRCTGRTAHVVEARRPGEDGAAALAGRFWVDDDTGLLLRREVFDRAGRRLSASAFLDLSVLPDPSATPTALRTASTRPRAAGASGELSRAELERLRAQGAVVPASLPGGFTLFSARTPQGTSAEGPGVLHLSYSDGLATTSLFSQPGSPGSTPPEGFASATVAGHPVWASSGAPRRLVWAGGGQVWTLVSDAPDDAVAAAVGALPHAAMPAEDTGLRARLARGLSRLATALNPFS